MNTFYFIRSLCWVLYSMWLTIDEYEDENEEE